jgi:hypothetical protein
MEAGEASGVILKDRTHDGQHAQFVLDVQVLKQMKYKFEQYHCGVYDPYAHVR